MILEESSRITAASLPIPISQSLAKQESGFGPRVPANGDGMSLEEHEKLLVVRAFDKTIGNQTQAARLLQITRDTLRYKMKKYGLRYGLRPISPLDNSCCNEYIETVTGKLAAELKQNKPFALIEEEAVLNLVRTHEHIQQRQTEFFRQFQLTPTQYNILRILRGAGKGGVTCSQAAERMLTADPDITRLLDRLEARRLIERERGVEDRRVVIGRITADGLELLRGIDKPLAAFMKEQVGRIGRERLTKLIEILESIREP